MNEKDWKRYSRYLADAPLVLIHLSPRHAGIFNTGFTSPLLQLSLYDSILYSRLFEDVSEGAENIEKLLTEMRTFFDDIIQKVHHR